MTANVSIEPVESLSADDEAMSVSIETVTAATSGPVGNRGVHWYRADTLFGKVFVSLQSMEQASFPAGLQSNDGRLLDAARALGREESLLEKIEDWLGLSLDLELAGVPEETYARVVVSPAGSSADVVKGSALLLLPLEILTRIAQQPSKLDERYELHWAEYPCQLILDLFVVPKEQLRHLDRGALLMIPASFDANWQCCMRPITEPRYSCSLFLRRKESCLEFESLLEKNQVVADGEWVEVRYTRSMDVPIDKLLNDSQRRTLLLPQALSRFSVEIVTFSGRIATGSLLPIGDGHGVYVEDMGQTEKWI